MRRIWMSLTALLLLTSPALAGSRLDDLTATLVAVSRPPLRAFGPPPAPVPVAALEAVAKARQAELLAVIADHPDLVIKNALTPAQRAALPRPVAAHVETREAIVGPVVVVHEDREDGTSAYRHFVAPAVMPRLDPLRAKARVALYATTPVQELRTGQRIVATGIRVVDAMALTQPPAVLPTVPTTLAVAGALGEQKTLGVIVSYTDAANTMTEAGTRAGLEAVSAFYRDVSYGKTWLAIDVVAVSIPRSVNGPCDFWGFQTQADIGAPAGVYHRKVYLLPKTPACQWSGLGTVGGAPSAAWVNGPSSFVGVVSHEVGHGFGLYHSHALECPGAVVATNCSKNEYGDWLDTMGSGLGRHFNAAQKELLGWLGGPGMPPLITVGASGTFTLEPMGMAPAGGPKGLKVKGQGNDWYYVEYRAPFGADAPLASALTQGAILHLKQGGSADGIMLLDTTPGSRSYDISDGAILVGQTYRDAAANVSIATTARTATALAVQVTTGTNPPPLCVRKPPTVEIVPGDATVGAGAAAVAAFSVRVTNLDIGCARSDYPVTIPILPPGWSVAPALISQLATGATAALVLSVTTAPGTLVGDVPLGVVVTNGGAPATWTTASALVRVVQTLSFRDTFDRAAGPIGNGWSVLAGRWDVDTQTMGMNGASGGLHAAVRQDIVGTNGTVTGTFASTSNNLAPAFGVYVRYQDPRNYLACWRTTGGSSLLRIVQATNGVEKVLRQAGIGNPTARAWFTLTCRVSGTTVSFSSDKTAISAPLNQVLTGFVGMAIKTAPTSTIQHRAESFTSNVQ